MGVGGTADFYYKEALRVGYVARSAFKLVQIQKQHNIISHGASVLDLGCAPGGWLQVACQSLGPIHLGGFVLGVDTKKVKPPPLHCDSRVHTISADVTTLSHNRLRSLSPNQNGFSVILSDMCPLISGITTKDAALSFELGMRALDFALGTTLHQPYSSSSQDLQGLLKLGGHLVIKLLQSEDAKEINQLSKPFFRKTSWLRPKATRPSSREIYLICQGLNSHAKI